MKFNWRFNREHEFFLLQRINGNRTLVCWRKDNPYFLYDFSEFKFKLNELNH